jgi:hypothetical protein
MEEKQRFPFTGGQVMNLPLGRVRIAAFHPAPPVLSDVYFFGINQSKPRKLSLPSVGTPV